VAAATFKIPRYEPMQETKLYRARRYKEQRKTFKEMVR
jgi:hypothetical protein